MSLIYVGDETHRYFQKRHVEILSARFELEAIYWSTSDLNLLERFDELSKKSALAFIASRHGAIPVIHWVARNPGRCKKLVLLHPSLHMNLAGMEPPEPHFVQTLLLCHSRVTSPGYEELSTLASRFFHDYTLHLTAEPIELEGSLSLLSFDDKVSTPA